MARGALAPTSTCNRETIVRTADAAVRAAGLSGHLDERPGARPAASPSRCCTTTSTTSTQLLLEITDGHVARLEALVGEVAGAAAGARRRGCAQLIRRFVHEYAQARHDHGVLTAGRASSSSRRRPRPRAAQGARASSPPSPRPIAEARPGRSPTPALAQAADHAAVRHDQLDVHLAEARAARSATTTWRRSSPTSSSAACGAVQRAAAAPAALAPN